MAGRYQVYDEFSERPERTEASRSRNQAVIDSDFIRYDPDVHRVSETDNPQHEWLKDNEIPQLTPNEPGRDAGQNRHSWIKDNDAASVSKSSDMSDSKLDISSSERHNWIRDKGNSGASEHEDMSDSKLDISASDRHNWIKDNMVSKVSKKTPEDKPVVLLDGDNVDYNPGPHRFPKDGGTDYDPKKGVKVEPKNGKNVINPYSYGGHRDDMERVKGGLDSVESGVRRVKDSRSNGRGNSRNRPTRVNIKM